MKYKFSFVMSLFFLGICTYLFYIKSFFNHYLNMQNCLSQSDFIIKMDDQSRNLPRIFYNNINEIKGITRVDVNEQGRSDRAGYDHGPWH